MRADHEFCHVENGFEKHLEKMKGEKYDCKSYLEQVEFRVPLDQLYQIHASCHHTEGSEFCGLLVKIIDEKTLDLNDRKKWLVQVWKKGG